MPAKMPAKKFKTPLMVTTHDDWLTLWSEAHDPAALRDDIECALDEGSTAVDDIGVWERVEKLPSRPRDGTYVVTTVDAATGSVVEIYSHAVRAVEIHAMILSAKDSIVEQKAEATWATAVWRMLATDIDRRLKVAGVYVTEGRGKKRTNRRLA